MLNQPVIIMGLGELGGVFARAFLKNDIPVYPLTRSIRFTEVLAQIEEPLFTLVAVAEKDIEPALASLPRQFRDNVILLQNELLPPTWQRHQILNPTVISVWFEKKQGMEVKILRPSPVFGKHAETVSASLKLLDIQCRIIDSFEDMLHHLVLKNLFVLTINILGLKYDITVDDLLRNHYPEVEALSDEILLIQEGLTGSKFDHKQFRHDLDDTLKSARDHKIRGRSAGDRLARTIRQSDILNLNNPFLHSFNAKGEIS